MDGMSWHGNDGITGLGCFKIGNKRQLLGPDLVPAVAVLSSPLPCHLRLPCCELSREREGPLIAR